MENTYEIIQQDSLEQDGRVENGLIQFSKKTCPVIVRLKKIKKLDNFHSFLTQHINCLGLLTQQTNHTLIQLLTIKQ